VTSFNLAHPPPIASPVVIPAAEELSAHTDMLLSCISYLSSAFCPAFLISVLLFVLHFLSQFSLPLQAIADYFIPEGLELCISFFTEF
jgi:hypothetical protein